MAQASTNGNSAKAAEETSKGKTDTAAIQAQLETLQKDVAELTRVLAEYGKTQKDNASAQAKAQAEKLRSQAEDTYAQAEAQARAAYTQAESAVRENPASAMAIATGIGFLVGLVMSRR